MLLWQKVWKSSAWAEPSDNSTKMLLRERMNEEVVSWWPNTLCRKVSLLCYALFSPFTTPIYLSTTHTAALKNHLRRYVFASDVGWIARISWFCFLAQPWSEEKSESGTGGESTATKIKDSTASVTEIKTKKSDQREGGKKRTGGNGREWVAGQKPHPVRLKLSRPPGHGVVAQAGGKIKQRVTGLEMAKTNTRNRQPPRHLHAMTISMIKTDE